MTALDRIIAEIKNTNNGKLMLRNLTLADREAVPALVSAGHLEYARFIDSRDSVCVAGHAAKYGMPMSEIRPASRYQGGACEPWFDGPDYESAIMARQDAAGYYD